MSLELSCFFAALSGIKPDCVYCIVRSAAVSCINILCVRYYALFSTMLRAKNRSVYPIESRLSTTYTQSNNKEHFLRTLDLFYRGRTPFLTTIVS